jgi:tetratricopeptide (TPR) repeat protein
VHQAPEPAAAAPDDHAGPTPASIIEAVGRATSEDPAALPGLAEQARELAAQNPADPESARAVLTVAEAEFDDTAKLAAADAVLALVPDDISATVSKVSALGSLGREREARELLNEASAKHAGEPRILSARGWLDLAERRWDDAERAFAAMADHAGFEDLALTSRTFLMTTRRRFGEARQIVHELRRQSSEVGLVDMNAAVLGIRSGNLADAEIEIRKLPSDFGPLSATALTMRGVLSAARDENHEARATLERLTRLYPAYVAARGALAVTMLRTGDESMLDEVERLSWTILETHPQNSTALLCIGLVAERRGRIDEAIDFLRMSQERDPSAGAATILGALYSRTGRLDEAEAALAVAIEAEVDPSQGHVELGNVLMKRDRPGEALDHFRQAMAANRLNEFAPRATAIALWHRGDRNGAERTLRDAIERLPVTKRWRLYLGLSALLVERGDETKSAERYEEALRAAERARQLCNGDADPHVQTGIVYFKLRHFVRAQRAFARALDRNPECVEAQVNLHVARAALVRQGRRGAVVGGAVLGTLAVLLLGIVWIAYLTRDDFPEEALLTLTPLLLGFLVVAASLPHIIQFRVGALEAELSQVIQTSAPADLANVASLEVVSLVPMPTLN